MLPAALEEPTRAWGITQGTCGLEEEAGRWLRDFGQLAQWVYASVSQSAVGIARMHTTLAGSEDEMQWQ